MHAQACHVGQRNGPLCLGRCRAVGEPCYFVQSCLSPSLLTIAFELLVRIRILWYCFLARCSGCANTLLVIVRIRTVGIRSTRMVRHGSCAVQASAFATAMATAVSPDCNCDLTATITADAVENIIAEASAMASASVCVSATPPSASELFPLVLTSCSVKHRTGEGAQILSMLPCF